MVAAGGTVAGDGIRTAGGCEVVMAVAISVAVGCNAIGGFIGEGGLCELLGEVVNAIGQAGGPGNTGTGCSWDALERVVFFRRARRLSKRSAGLVVRPVGLPGVGEEGHDGGDALGRASLAGGDHDAEINEVVIDIAGAGLDDVDILATDGVLDLTAAFAAGEF